MMRQQTQGLRAAGIQDVGRRRRLFRELDPALLGGVFAISMLLAFGLGIFVLASY